MYTYKNNGIYVQISHVFFNLRPTSIYKTNVCSLLIIITNVLLLSKIWQYDLKKRSISVILNFSLEYTAPTSSFSKNK